VTHGGRATCDELLEHRARVAETMGQLPAAAVLLELAHAEGAEALARVDVRHGAHQRTEDDFGVVLRIKATLMRLRVFAIFAERTGQKHCFDFLIFAPPAEVGELFPDLDKFRFH